MSIISLSSYKNLAEKCIFLRLDLNLSIKNNVFSDFFRFTSIVPTLNYLHNQGSRVVICTHMGNPDPENPSPSLSTRHLIPLFEQHGFDITFASTLEEAVQSPSRLLLLENVRFFKGEKNCDQQFAHRLASLAQIYVNDAFGTMHRADASIVLVPQEFSSDKRAMGFLVEKEIAALRQLKNSPQQPFMLVVGGAKLDDKIPLLEQYMKNSKQNQPDHIIIGGALSLPFLASQGIYRNQSALSEKTIECAGKILEHADKQGIKISLPSDMRVNINNTIDIMPIEKVPNGALCGDIGPATETQFCAILSTAQSIFVNGTMGIYEDPIFEKGTKTILTTIAATKAYTVAGGGDCVAAVHHFNLADHISFISTGGGATLAYLSSDNPEQDLPGLHALSCC